MTSLQALDAAQTGLADVGDLVPLTTLRHLCISGAALLYRRCPRLTCA
jgi:hypothetical protein